MMAKEEGRSTGDVQTATALSVSGASGVQIDRVTIASRPEHALASLDVGRSLLATSSLTERQKMLIVLRVAARRDYPERWANHVAAGYERRLSDHEIESLRDSRIDANWGSLERAMIDAIDQVLGEGRVHENTWDLLAASWSQDRLMDFLYVVGYFAMNAMTFAPGLRES